LFKRHWKKIVWTLLILLGLYGGAATFWDMRYVQPRVERWPDPVPLALKKGLAPKDYHYEITHDLVSLLGSSQFETPSIDKAIAALPKNLDARPNYREPHLLSRLTTFGSSSNFRTSRRAIHLPPPGIIQYNLTIPPDAIMRGAYGVLPEQPAPVTFSISIDGETILSKTEESMLPFPYVERDWFYKKYYRYAHVEIEDREARWVPFEIDLSPWAGREVDLKLQTQCSGDSSAQAFWGSPQILEKKLGPPQTVVIYVMDAFSARNLGVYGCPHGLTPELDSFAKKGVVVESYISGGNWSRTGVTTMLTGKAVPNLYLPTSPPRRPLNHAIRKLFESAEIETLPAAFRKAGWESLCVANNYFIMPWAKAGIDLGFDQTTQAMRSNISTMDVEYFVARQLAENKDTNLFLFIHQNAPNPADAPPNRFRRISKHAWKGSGDYAYGRYLGCVAHADFTFARFYQMLRQTGLLKNSFIFVTADHGQINDISHDIKTPNGPDKMRKAMHFHGQTLYDEEFKIPMIIYGPEIAGDRILKGQYSSLSVFPTIMSLVGVENNPNASARNLAPFLLSNNPTFEPEPVIALYGKNATGIRVADRYKYIRHHDINRLRRVRRAWKPETLREELFDLQSDPEETQNLVGADDPLLQRMRRQFEESTEQFPSVWALTIPESSADEVIISGAKKIAVASGEILARSNEKGLRLKLEKTVRLAIWPDSDAEELRFTLMKQGHALQRTELRYGPAFVMPDGDQGYLIDDSTNIAKAKTAYIPQTADGSEHPHLCFVNWIDWINQMPTGSGVDSAVKDLLKQWGYVH